MKKTARSKIRFTVVPFLFFSLLLLDPGTTNLRAACSSVTGNNQNDWRFDYPSESGIEPGYCANITVLKGVAPYQWSSNDPEFVLDPDKTQAEGPNNTVCLTLDACGAGEITVTDGNGWTAKAYVRSSAGQWVQTEDCSPGARDGIWVVTAVVGKYYYDQDWCVEPCETNCLGGPCDPNTNPPDKDACWVEASTTWEWICQ